MGNDRKFLKKKINEERNNYGNKGPWWYFTLHGLGPGMIPRDVNVVDSVEGVNKKGTRGLFIALDGVLTYDELKQYDLIELAPPKAMQECRESLKESKSLKEAKEEDFYFRAFITNLGKYNEGYLIGEWVDFPIDKDKFDEVLKKNGIGEGEYEEWFVTDYESNMPGFNWMDFGEYTSYDALEEFGEKVQEINESGQGKAIANAYEVTDDLQKAIDGVINGDIIFYDGIYDDYDLGSEIIAQFYGEDIPEDLIERYFDFEKLGRDIRLEYYPDDDMPETAGEYWAGDENASDYDIGEAVVEDIGIEGVNNKDYYFDFEAFGRDLFYENFYSTTDGTIEMT